MGSQHLLISVLLMPLLVSCASNFDTQPVGQLTIEPGVSTSKELVAQAGLPSRVEKSEIEGKKFQRFVYLKGPDSSAVFVPIPIVPPSANVADSIYVGQIPREKADADMAFYCVISDGDIVLNCYSPNTQ